MSRVTGNVETLRWRDGRLEMIDQRLLPGELRYLSFDSAESVANGIRAMVVRGAPAIGCAAAYGIALEARKLQHLLPEEFGAGLEAGMTVLAGSRPTAVNLFWSLARMRRCWEAASEEPPPEIANLLLTEALAVHREDVAANRSIGRHGAELVPDGSSILTHCNAGALATAGHGTALGVIRSAIEAGKSLSVFATETRPFLQGARLTAWELAQDGIAVTLIADSAAGFLMSRGEIDLVVVGADRIAANGDVANKIGTYTLAVLAERHRIPFYVAAPLSTIDCSLATGAAIPIEDRGADEIRGFGGQQWTSPDVKARNPVFDVTPAGLIRALITEVGVVPPGDAGKLSRGR